MRTYNIGDTIYHERRYWKTDNLLPHEEGGWNTEYMPFKVVRITAKRITVEHEGVTVHLPRGARPKKPGHARHEYLEADGRQYHSRFHEYFYAEIPKAKPLSRNAVGTGVAPALSLLGITPPYSDSDVKKAYKRLALKTHPDQGGNHNDFIRLKDARDVALRGY